MRRRTLLTAIGAGAATAGCLGLAPTSSEHPLAGETQSVQVRADSTSPHDLSALAAAALSFWADNSEQYAGFPVEFELGAESLTLSSPTATVPPAVRTSPTTVPKYSAVHPYSTVARSSAVQSPPASSPLPDHPAQSA